MIRNLEEFSGNKEVSADVCIVGAGAAGITLAREFVGASFNVCVLEAGTFDYDLRAQSLYEGRNIGFPYYPLDAVRSRYFGGTTNHWAGACRPLDDIDFEIRPSIPHSGWPVSKSDLDPYYVRAHDVCKLGPYIYDPSYWATSEAQPLSFATNDIQTAMMQAQPTRFGPTYRDELDQARDVDIYLSANVVDLESSPDGQAIRRVHAKSFGGRELIVSAKVFILATGAIENARLLLASNRIHKSGLGNQYDLVGRYFMEHLSLPGAILAISNADQLPSALYQGAVTNGVSGLAFLVPSAALQRREGMLNIRAFLVSSSAEELSAKANEAVLSAGFIWNDLRAGRMPRNFERHLRNVITDIDGVAIYSYQRSYHQSR
jgi:choline dehydrogenase-like flavoprotein